MIRTLTKRGISVQKEFEEQRKEMLDQMQWLNRTTFLAYNETPGLLSVFG